MSVSITPPMFLQFFVPGTNQPAVGYQLFTYQATTSTKQATWTDSTQTTQNANPIIADSNGIMILWLDPTLTYKFVLASNNDTDPPSSPLRSVDNISPTVTAAYLTQSLIVSLLYPRTVAEISAGVTPVNFSYPPFYVDRYATNTTPGTTDMTAAFQAAINVAKKVGGVIRYGITWPYLLTSPLDCTYASGATTFGFTIEADGNAAAITFNSPSYPTILAKHTGVAVFDCTGAVAINFNRVNIGTDVATFPKCGWLLARNSGGGGNIHRFNNCRVLGSFSEAVVYNYGAEDDQYDACQFFNLAGTANAKVMAFTGTNYRSLTSPFVTIATGGQSCIDHKIIGGEYLNQSHNANADVFYLDSISSLKVISPWAGCADGTGGGRSIVFCDTTNGPSNLVTLFGITAENTAHSPSVGVLLGSAAATPSYWVIESCTFPNASLAISAQASVVCDDFHIKAISNQSVGGGITIAGTLQNSHIDELALPIVIGTSNSNLLNVSMTSLTVTTRSGDFWAGPGVQTWTPNTSALTITGALTISNKRVQYNGSEVTVTMDMSAATSIVCAQGTALSGLPVANITDSAVSLVTNRNTGILIGTAQISGTSLLLPAINVGANIVVTITAKYFCA
jgi:hypothetical protein